MSPDVTMNDQSLWLVVFGIQGEGAVQLRGQLSSLSFLLLFVVVLCCVVLCCVVLQV